MKLNKKRTAALAALACLVIAGGAAYTDADNTTAVTDGYNVAGYGSVDVTGGVTIVELSYNLTGDDPAAVSSVNFVTSGNTTNASGYIGFNSTSTLGAACSGTLDSSGDAWNGDTVYSQCPLPGGSTELVSDINSTDIAVAPTTPPTT